MLFEVALLVKMEKAENFRIFDLEFFNLTLKIENKNNKLKCFDF